MTDKKIPTDLLCSQNNDSAIKCSNPDQCVVLSANNLIQQNYLNYDDIVSTDHTNVYCGCDKDVVAKFKEYKFDTTLGDLWKEATDAYNAGECDNLYDEYNLKLLTIAQQDNDPSKLDKDKLSVLTAYEMCRITNKLYPRKVTNESNKTTEQKWQDLINGDSKTSKNLHRGFKVLVFLMLTHTLFRMFIPSGAGPKVLLVMQCLCHMNFLKVIIE